MRSRLLAAAAASTIMLTTLAACGGSDDTSDDTSEAKGCTYPSSAEPGTKAEVPPTEPVSATTMTITTNRGVITATLKPDAAPCTVNAFVSLAAQKFFDGTKCHRLVPGFVLQCGDPTATGTGGPGFSFPDELTGSETYPAGTLAMANAGPDTNGSQFFIVLADATENLPKDFTVFGTVDAAGLKVAQEIEAGGNGPDGQSPAQDVILESVTTS